MITLPIRFNSWNKFLERIEQSEHFNEDVETIVYDNKSYNIDEVKLEAFKELRKIFPERKFFANDVSSIICGDHRQVPTWVHKLADILI